jgi:hypothetical protein
VPWAKVEEEKPANEISNRKLLKTGHLYVESIGEAESHFNMAKVGSVQFVIPRSKAARLDLRRGNLRFFLSAFN